MPQIVDLTHPYTAGAQAGGQFLGMWDGLMGRQSQDRRQAHAMEMDRRALDLNERKFGLQQQQFGADLESELWRRQQADREYEFALEQAEQELAYKQQILALREREQAFEERGIQAASAYAEMLRRDPTLATSAADLTPEQQAVRQFVPPEHLARFDRDARAEIAMQREQEARSEMAIDLAEAGATGLIAPEVAQAATQGILSGEVSVQEGLSILEEAVNHAAKMAMEREDAAAYQAQAGSIIASWGAPTTWTDAQRRAGGMYAVALQFGGSSTPWREISRAVMDASDQEEDPMAMILARLSGQAPGEAQAGTAPLPPGFPAEGLPFPSAGQRPAPGAAPEPQAAPPPAAGRTKAPDMPKAKFDAAVKEVSAQIDMLHGLGPEGVQSAVDQILRQQGVENPTPEQRSAVVREAVARAQQRKQTRARGSVLREQVVGDSPALPSGPTSLEGFPMRDR